MIHASRILVIVGSTRPRRICRKIAEWVAEVGRETVAGEFEIVDLKDWRLPMDDEPGIPAAGGAYAFEHTSAWSRKIAEATAFVFVTPQYNWGYPAPLKNALDHLYNEWSGKPAMIVSYGGHGGDRCARQLRQVLKGLHMKPVATMPGFRLARARIEANDGIIEPAAAFAHHRKTLKRAFAELAAALDGKRARHRWLWQR
jgi:NAD(P)H-dependent FMN reductase